MSPGGIDASLLALAAGFFAAAAIIAMITMVLRRRSGHQDLLGTQVGEMEARAAAASPEADTWIADARSHETAPAPAEAAPDTSPTDPASPGTGSQSRPAPDGTAPPPHTWSAAPGGENDAMVDAFAWLRIAALVEAGQREQAVELLSTTMTISAAEAEMLIDGLNDAGGERQPG